MCTKNPTIQSQQNQDDNKIDRAFYLIGLKLLGTNFPIQSIFEEVPLRGFLSPITSRPLILSPNVHRYSLSITFHLLDRYFLHCVEVFQAFLFLPISYWMEKEEEGRRRKLYVLPYSLVKCFVLLVFAGCPKGQCHRQLGSTIITIGWLQLHTLETSFLWLPPFSIRTVSVYGQ